MSDTLKVLIVDDSAITRGLFEKAFLRNSFEIAGSVSNGRKAVDFCRENRVDVVVSDFNMPEMNGIDSAKMIISEFGIPVVIYSDDISIKTDVLAAGAAFEKKPSLQTFDEVDLNEFTKKVKIAVKKQILKVPVLIKIILQKTLTLMKKKIFLVMPTLIRFFV